MLAGCLAYSLTLKMEVVHSSESFVNVYHTAWRNIKEDIILLKGVNHLEEFGVDERIKLKWISDKRGLTL
jgi:hypothetical protein